MEINSENNNLNKDILSMNVNKNKRPMKNNIFTKKGMKTSKDIADINENDFNISNFSPYIAYFTSNNSSNVKKIIKEKAFSNIVLNNEESERSYENVTSYTNQNMNTIKSKNLGKLNNNISNISSVQRTKAKKRVKFKPNFINVIEIESFKKYNLNEYFNNRTNCINCSCHII